MFYETIKSRVENSFGACYAEEQNAAVPESHHSFDTGNIKRVLLSCLDALTNKGLYKIATLLAGGSTNFEKTRRKMKKVIKESLAMEFQNQNHKSQKQIYIQLSLVLNETQNFRENCGSYLTPMCKSHRAAATKVLHELEDLPFQTLFVMHKKLRGIQGGIPRLRHWRHGRSREQVINQIRKYSEKMLLELSKGDHLQERLAKALAIVGLSKKVELEGQTHLVEDFCQYTPEVKKLQDEIVKAIWLLKTKVRMPELKTLQKLLDPDSDVSNGCLRTAMRKMLIDYLFECSDMDTIPKSFLEAIALINRDSRSVPHNCFSKEEIEEEVEHVLSVSAQTKQIVLDLVPGIDFDWEFDDAYMEELEESEEESSDDDDGFNDGVVKLQNIKSSVDWDLQEGFGESMCIDPKTPISKTYSFARVKKEHVMDSNPHGIISSGTFIESRFSSDAVSIDRNQDDVKSIHMVSSSGINTNRFTPIEENARSDPRYRKDLFSSNSSCWEMKCKSYEQRKSGNHYLAIQEACDETSMVAYDLIGGMLENFAHEEGIDLESSSILYLKGQSSSQECTKGMK